MMKNILIGIISELEEINKNPVRYNPSTLPPPPPPPPTKKLLSGNLRQ